MIMSPKEKTSDTLSLDFDRKGKMNSFEYNIRSSSKRAKNKANAKKLKEGIKEVSPGRDK